MRTWLRPILVLGIGWYSFGFTAGKYELPPASTPTPSNPAASVLKEISNGLTSISLQAKKALVFVSVSKTMRGQGAMPIDPFDLFGYGPQQRSAPMPAPKQEGLGSGFIIDLDKRYIITNNHVVEDADEITVKLANGEIYPAKVVGRDPNTDVAVIQIINEKYKRDDLGALVLGDSDEALVGALVVALGAPFGLEASVSLGVISARGRGNLQITALGDFIQTDAAINPGNSGGPLINMDGKVIGMNTAIASRSGGYNGVGFASPSNLVRQVAISLINEGTVHRGWVGVAFQPFKSEWAHSMKLPKGTAGVIALQVTKGGPADRAGIQPQDVIIGVDNKPLSDENNDLVNIVGLKKPGEKVRFDFYRNGQRKTADLEIGAWDGQAHASVKTGEPKNSVEKNKNPFGLSVHQTKKGMLITAVEPKSPAQMEGLQKNDLILFANGTILMQQDFYELLKSADEVLLFIERNEKTFLVHLNKNRSKK